MTRPATATAHPLIANPGTCMIGDSTFTATCDQPAVAVITGSCVHEHRLPPAAVCPLHLAAARLDGLLCGDCQRSADPHHCLARPLSDTALVSDTTGTVSDT